MKWLELAATDFDDALEKSEGVAIIPIGSIEIHGPHLPVGCDTLIAGRVVEMVADWMLQSLDNILKCPIDAVYITDDYADQRGVIFGLERFRKIFKPHWKRILGKLKNAGVYSVLHVCGNAEPALPDLIECGLDCLLFDD